jgi:PAS domain S-box-containing protein
VTEQDPNASDIPLKVLLVDDDRDDYVLTRGMLSKARGGSTQLEWVASYETALETIARGEHDVVLVDYRLGERSGVELVAQAVQCGARAPLILLTGQGGHEVDVEAMHAGAADFLLKSDLNPALLERSIRYAIERRRSKDELDRSLSVLRATLESTGDGILVIDVDARVAGYNQKFAEMWGVPRAMLEAKDDAPVLAWVTAQLEDPSAFLHRVQQLYADPQATSYDVLRLKDGRIFERYSQPQVIAGQSHGRVWSFHDVSERERGAEALRHSETLKAAILETALDCIITMNSEGRVVEWNPAAEKNIRLHPHASSGAADERFDRAARASRTPHSGPPELSRHGFVANSGEAHRNACRARRRQRVDNRVVGGANPRQRPARASFHRTSARHHPA